MGQQQLLFLILGVCIIGVAISTGMIVLQSGAVVDDRQALQSELMKIASAAQQYHDRSFEENGGDGTFVGLTSTPQGINKLAQPSSTTFGDFSIARSGNAQSVQILAVSHSPGNDPRKPITMIMNVFADRTSIVTLN